MEESDVGVLVRDAFMVVVKLGGPPLFAAMAVGLVVSLLQAMTQINEQTLAFVPKVAAVAATLLLLGGFMSDTLADFTRLLFDRLVAIGGSLSVQAVQSGLLPVLPQLAFDAALLLARIGCTCMLLPVLGEAEVPAIVRAGFVVAFVALLLPVLLPRLPPLPSQPLVLAGMVGAEVLTGLWLGWLARMTMLALTTAGQMAALLVGQSSVLQQDPALGASTAALGRLMTIAAPVILLASGLYATPLLALAGSYAVIAPGALLPAADTALGVATAVASTFALSVQLVAPFVLASFGWHVAVALLGRLVPQMQAHLMGLAAPAQLLLGLLLLALLVSGMFAVWQGRAGDAFAALPGL